VTGFLHGDEHWRHLHQQMECCLLKIAVCRGDYRGNVGSVDRKAVGDYDGFDVGVNSSCTRNPPRFRAVEVGSNSGS